MFSNNESSKASIVLLQELLSPVATLRLSTRLAQAYGAVHAHWKLSSSTSKIRVALGGMTCTNTFAKISDSPSFMGHRSCSNTEHLPLAQFTRYLFVSATHPSSSTGTIAEVRRDGQLCPLSLGQLCDALVPTADHFTSSQPAKNEHNCQSSM